MEGGALRLRHIQPADPGGPSSEPTDGRFPPCQSVSSRSLSVGGTMTTSTAASPSNPGGQAMRHDPAAPAISSSSSSSSSSASSSSSSASLRLHNSASPSADRLVLMLLLLVPLPPLVLLLLVPLRSVTVNPGRSVRLLPPLHPLSHQHHHHQHHHQQQHPIFFFIIIIIIILGWV